MDFTKVRAFESKMKEKYGDDFNPVDIFSTEDDYIESVEDGTAEEKVDNFFDNCVDDDYLDDDDYDDSDVIEFDDDDSFFEEDEDEEYFDEEDMYDTEEDY